ncbi:MliC family protein [Jhaorihella thermophila]|uniref:Membrane-bound lysozyme-inhibitor of c-type lysozyme n=1 Tax=Jhaorihella thermophila TaxID=488547 RepID=A0A1H5RPE2_9RHOB|nr:MliC family protein [Jhaorihella thermophila]SEF39417.1 Membrane-bound lysozyme-inhibitor of c-type lysozyme [Jhaorihella thermophila]
MSPVRALIGAAMALPPCAAHAGTEVVEIVYECEQRGVRLPVVFVNTEGGPGLAVMSIEGKLVTMRSTPNGSGVRYVAIDEQDSYRLHAKGETAFVTWLAADHTADEITILRDCWMIDEKGR